METENGDRADRDGDVLARALEEALAGLDDAGAIPGLTGVDRESLRAGLRIGIERPALARLLLDQIAAGQTAASAGAGAAGPGSPVDPAPADALEPGGIPVASMLLARSAAMPPAERETSGPDVVFGWATRLPPPQILSVGRAAERMLAAGAPSDTGRAFGIAWDGGVRMPRRERDGMLGEFVELEVSVAGVLAGRDLRAVEHANRPGLGGTFERWFRSSSRDRSPVDSAIAQAGDHGRLALVAMWNAWVALRYRALVPAPLFAQLVEPWVTVVGPLPDR